MKSRRARRAPLVVILAMACQPAVPTSVPSSASSLVATGVCGRACSRSWPLLAPPQDNARVLQAAVDWLSIRGGGTIVLPSGTFDVRDAAMVIATSNLHVRGSGKHATTLVQQQPLQAGMFQLGATAPIENISISDLTIEGHGTVLGDYERRVVNNVGVRFVGDTSHVEVHDIAMSGFGIAIAAHYVDSKAPTLHGASFMRCDLFGLEPLKVMLHAGIELNAEDAVVADNQISGFAYGINPSYFSRRNHIVGNHVVVSPGAGVGIYMSSAQDTTCEDNTIEMHLPVPLDGYAADGCIKVGAALHPIVSSSFVVANNTCTNGSIKLANATHGVVRGNTITGSIASAIYLDSYVDATHPTPLGADIAIEDNVITHPAGSGVYFPVADKVRVRNNQITACGSVGVWLQNARDSLVEKNQIKDCTNQAVMAEQARSTTISENVIDHTSCQAPVAQCPVGIVLRDSDASVAVTKNQVAGYKVDVRTEPK